jgi:hypothetical protein
MNDYAATSGPDKEENMATPRPDWTRPATIMAIALLGALAVLTAGCGSSGDGGSSVTSTTAGGLISEQQVVDLVDTTSAAIEKDAAATLAAIDAGKPPYRDPSNPALYAFVYDTQVTLIATPDATVRGQNMKGKPDAAGAMFRDEIVSGALANGSGWVKYVYKEPGQEGLFEKATYYTLATGSDGEKYVVCAGRYLGPYQGTPSTTSSNSSATSASPPTTSPTQPDVQAFVFAGEKGGRHLVPGLRHLWTGRMTAPCFGV